MKQEHKVESLNKCIDGLQQQTYAQRLELHDVHHGFVESRRGQVRLQENIYETKISSRDSKYARYGANEEISGTTSWRILCTKVERKSWNNTETHFTIARIIRKDVFFDWLWRIPRSRVELQWKISDVPSQPAVIPSPRSMTCWAATTLATWNM